LLLRLAERGASEITSGIEGRWGSKKGKKGKKGKKLSLFAFLAPFAFLASALHSFKRCLRCEYALTSIETERRETSDSLLARMALDQFDANLVRPFDECEFDLAARERANLIRHLDAVFAQLLHRFGQIRDAESDVVDDAAFGRIKL